VLALALAPRRDLGHPYIFIVAGNSIEQQQPAGTEIAVAADAPAICS
jgi:hypothetical protein